MKYKVIELEGVMLDAAVAKAEGTMPSHGWVSPDQAIERPPLPGQFERFSDDWREGGPIVERERIDISFSNGWRNGPIYGCEAWPQMNRYTKAHMWGKTALIAAMRAYVASKYGEEVELP